jgi:hypothetical protein
MSAGPAWSPRSWAREGTSSSAAKRAGKVMSLVLLVRYESLRLEQTRETVCVDLPGSLKARTGACETTFAVGWAIPRSWWVRLSMTSLGAPYC